MAQGFSRDTDMTKGLSLERRMSCRGTVTELDVGGLCPFQLKIGLGRPRRSSRRFMTSSFLHEHFGRWTRQFGTCGSLEKPKEG
jgi:hypothetical protein